MSRHNITREKNFTVSCIQINFNASKDIQEWMATVNLNLLTFQKKKKKSSYPYTGLTRSWRQINNDIEIYKHKKQWQPQPVSRNLQKETSRVSLRRTVWKWEIKQGFYKQKWFKSLILCKKNRQKIINSTQGGAVFCGLLVVISKESA